MIKCFTEEVLLLEHRLGVLELMLGDICRCVNAGKCRHG